MAYYVIVVFLSSPFISIFVLNRWFDHNPPDALDCLNAALIGMFCSMVWPITVVIFITLKIIDDKDKLK